MNLDYDSLRVAVNSDAALRRRQRLQPVGGRGDKIFPPTYPGEGRNAKARHVLERRRIEGEDIWCALVDSVQSQANRLEEVLLTAVRDDGLELPYIAVDFTSAELRGLGEITSLDAPHRVFDAIFRDSALDNVPYPKSSIGIKLTEAKLSNGTALLETSPTALLFGVWNSTGEGGGLGVKFPRSIVSEIMAMNVAVDDNNSEQRTANDIVRTGARKTSSRMDPLGIQKGIEIYKGEDKQWHTDKSKAGKKPESVRPSEINHGNIRPSVEALGVTCDYLEQVTVLTFAGLRRLGFGTPVQNQAARTYLASLAIVAIVEQETRGYSLRSRCDLVCDGRAPFEIVHPDGQSTPLNIMREDARRVFEEAKIKGEEVGFNLSNGPIRLMPQQKLIAIVKESQRLALEGKSEAADGEDD